MVVQLQARLAGRGKEGMMADMMLSGGDGVVVFILMMLRWLAWADPFCLVFEAEVT